MATSTNINNLNILTFIKDIYLSLKHIDNCFNSYKENIDSRLIKLEDNQQTILDKLTNIEHLLEKINLNTQNQVALDKNIENELMQKMNAMNKTSFQEKLNLKPEELTFANILENGYSLLDINKSINETINETLIKQNLSSTRTLVSPRDKSIDTSRDTSMCANSLDLTSLDFTDLDVNELDNTTLQNKKENKKEIDTLDNLLF